MSLKEYIRKRNFKKTAEPKGRVESASHNRFVIQKHAASRLHYDFRLELGGTLKSWAVPKGVPYRKGEKRLAVEVEDHPVSYIDFEGTIPKGQYGGGTVMVWDQGTFEPLSTSPVRELKGGKLHFVLHGKKLKGEWYLVRLREGNQWLLIKGGSDARRVSSKLENSSAASGRSMEEIARGNSVWHSNRNEKIQEARQKKAGDGKTRIAVARRKLSFIEPMKARLVEKPPTGDWIYEIKFDGFRALGIKEGREISLLSRNEKDFRQKFPEVAESLLRLKAESAVIDGEIVALNGEGHSSFQLLQGLELGDTRPPIYFYVFDLLQLNGIDLRREPVTVRKHKLEKLLKNGPGVLRYSATLKGNAAELLKQGQKLGLEGLIGKRADSLYEPGGRSGAWVKLKLHQQQEMVIGGFTNPEGGRAHFGALLVGYYQDRSLHFAGKVGTGFNDALLKSLYARMARLRASECPFVNLPEKKSGRFGSGVTLREMQRCHWVKPKLVCQIKFSEWTRDGKLRHPVFLGLREDKAASDVAREVPE